VCSAVSFGAWDGTPEDGRFPELALGALYDVYREGADWPYNAAWLR
jgi:hypothetical protein